MEKKNLKIIASCSATIFSLFSVFVATAAWFTARRTVDNQADNFQVVCNNEIVEEIYVHTQIQDSDDNSYLYDATPVGSYRFDNPNTNVLSFHANKTTPIGIGKYSIFENEKTMLFLYKFRDDIKDEVFSNLKFTAKNKTSQENSILKYDVNTGQPKTPLKADKNQLSSIIQFSALPLKDWPTSYDFSSYKTDIETNEKSFATINPNDTDSLSGYVSSLSLLSSTDGTKYKGIALILSYHVDALEYLFNINLGNEILDTEEEIKFDNVDFSLVL